MRLKIYEGGHNIMISAIAWSEIIKQMKEEDSNKQESDSRE